ncbi:MAG TPA: ABC transporter ATP-binding protein [Polyangia bacterium]|nr:ABC transporter ATP-binding protein [Polyangia bacterium]
MSAVAIKAVEVGKMYRLGERESYTALRDVMANTARRLLGRGTAKTERPILWSLRNVSFDVEQGDTVGIIGRNGAGKSTLLKILAQITRPTEGSIELRGKVGSLLEVGTGFHPELTGRDNVYLCGAILGMGRTEIQKKFDEIVAFAEVERFIDTPVKRFSSGMYMRLAFAVAAHLEPEILLVDEVLAVGDVAFQKKCIGKMGDVSKQGRTVLFVSHNMGAVNSLCRRSIWIHDGKVVADGKSQSVVADYMQAMRSGTLVSTAKGNEPLFIERVVLRNGRGEITDQFDSGDDISLEIEYVANGRIPRPNFWVQIANSIGQGVCIASTMFDGHNPEVLEGPGKATCVFKAPQLTPQAYAIWMGTRAADGVTLLSKSKEVAYFSIMGTMGDYGLMGETADMFLADFPWPIFPYEWHFPATGKPPVRVEMRRTGAARKRDE